MLSFVFATKRRLFIRNGRVVVHRTNGGVNGGRVQIFNGVVPIFVVLLHLRGGFSVITVSCTTLTTTFGLIRGLVVGLNGRKPCCFIVLPICLLIFVGGKVVLLLNTLWVVVYTKTRRGVVLTMTIFSGVGNWVVCGNNVFDTSGFALRFVVAKGSFYGTHVLPIFSRVNCRVAGTGRTPLRHNKRGL